MFSRATFMPAATSSRIFSSELVAGPMVHTIFARLTSVSLVVWGTARAAGGVLAGNGLRVPRKHEDPAVNGWVLVVIAAWLRPSTDGPSAGSERAGWSNR
ncbi:hypothetical protein GCM10027076_29250 [Nocardioides montaniterrae]